MKMTIPIKTSLLVVIASVIAFQATAAEPENSLEGIASLIANTDTNPAPLSITAIYRNHDSKRFLAFRITNTGKSPIEVPDGVLPWRRPFFLAVAALTIDGQRLQNKVPLPVTGSTSEVETYPIPKLLPGESIEGEFDLENKVVFPTPLPNDVILMWVFAAPRDIPNPTSWPPMWKVSGVVAIPKR